MPETESPLPEEPCEQTGTAETSPLLDVREAARFLRVSETSIRRWSDSGRLKCYRVGMARHRRFSLEDLKRFLESGGGNADSSGV